MRVEYAMAACALGAALCAAQTSRTAGQLEQYVKFGKPIQTEKFVAIETSGDSVVKGAPYCAWTLSEFEQTLADGNHISRSNKGMVCRDSDGRTRRQQPMGGMGLLGSAAQLPPVTIITDPVAGFSYTLNPQDKSVTKMPLPPPAGEGGWIITKSGGLSGRADSAAVSNGGGGQMVDVLKLQDKLAQAQKEYLEAKTTADSDRLRAAMDQIKRDLDAAQQRYDAGLARGGSVPTSAAMRPRPTRPSTAAPIPVEVSGNFKTESLGTKSFDGVVAEGTRTVTTIPAGLIGNERPIDAVKEWWYSPQLQVTVFSQYSDPRTGTTTERLSDISLAEPSPSLFSIPPDYTTMRGLKKTPVPKE